MVTYRYDTDNRLVKVSDWQGHNTTYNYDPGGRLTSGVSPGLVTIYRYDNASRLTKLMNYNANGTNMTLTSSFEYGMDENSNRELIRRFIPLANPAFNITNTTYGYNAGNQLITIGGQSVTYDNNGNMLSIPGIPAGSFTYNALNQLTQYNGTANMTFQYDALGSRIKKVDAGVTTRYIGGSTTLAESNAGGTLTAYYVHGLGLIAKINASDSAAYYYQYDGLGSTVALTNSTGAVKNKYAYDDFGQVAANSTETIANPFKYVGKYGVQTDAPDLLYMRARYYKPSIGRFINMDPIGLFFEIRIRTTGFIYLDGINLYSYVSNNPIRHTDSRGLFISPATAGYVLLAAMVIYLADWIAYNLRDCEKPESNGPAEDPVEVPRRAPPNGRSPPIR